LGQRRHQVLHPEVGASDLEVEQPCHLAGSLIDQRVRGRRVAVDDLDRQVAIER
jgi:hypothetical protein